VTASAGSATDRFFRRTPRRSCLSDDEAMVGATTAGCSGDSRRSWRTGQRSTKLRNEPTRFHAAGRRRLVIEATFSRYRIIRKLGSGGMGDVYLAEDTTLNRPVALKLLPAVSTQDDERVRRFKREANAEASRLNRPNILTVHEAGEFEGQHFIATEFVDGRTLRQMLHQGGRLGVSDALAIAAQVASALAAAHDAGIVHRDVKPENIMVRRDG
jgi:serine/threonine protein kinase